MERTGLNWTVLAQRLNQPVVGKQTTVLEEIKTKLDHRSRGVAWRAWHVVTWRGAWMEMDGWVAWLIWRVVDNPALRCTATVRRVDFTAVVDGIASTAAKDRKRAGNGQDHRQQRPRLTLMCVASRSSPQSTGNNNDHKPERPGAPAITVTPKNSDVSMVNIMARQRPHHKNTQSPCSVRSGHCHAYRRPNGVSNSDLPVTTPTRPSTSTTTHNNVHESSRLFALIL